MWHFHEGMGWWMVFGGIFMVLFWAAIIAFIVWGIKKATDRDKPETENGRKSNALKIVEERYARGEISKDEFERIKKDLT